MTDLMTLRQLVQDFSSIDWMSPDGRIHELAERYRRISPKVWLEIIDAQIEVGSLDIQPSSKPPKLNEADALTAVIYQLRKHQKSHQSWLDHYLVDPNHTCGRCTPEVLAGVGDAVEQEVYVKVYEGLIARVLDAQAKLRWCYARIDQLEASMNPHDIPPAEPVCL
jgi:hypothetical protein